MIAPSVATTSVAVDVLVEAVTYAVAGDTMLYTPGVVPSVAVAPTIEPSLEVADRTDSPSGDARSSRYWTQVPFSSGKYAAIVSLCAIGSSSRLRAGGARDITEWWNLE